MPANRNVTAIVVNYNAGSWLLKSVTALLESNVELGIYVVDNHSSDGSVEKLKQTIKSGRVKYIENKENKGFAFANNRVLNAIPSDYFVLVNPDCEVKKDTISRIIDEMERDPEIGLASCVIRDTNGRVHKTCRRAFPTPWSGFVRVSGLNRFFPKHRAFEDFDLGPPSRESDVEFVDAVSGAFMVARNEAVTKVGVLDEDYFLHCEDLDWCMRFWQAGYKVAFVSGAEVFHAKGVSGSSQKMKVNWHLHRGMIRFYSKFYREKYPPPVMWLVYCGIGVRFLVKEAQLLFVSLIPSLTGKS